MAENLKPRALHDWRPIFLAALADVPIVSNAARLARIDYRQVWRVRKEDADFAQAWDEAMEQGIDNAEQEAFRRAVTGYEEPVIDKGMLAYRYERHVDEEGKEHYRKVLDEHGQPVPLTVRKHSDALLSLILKGRRKNVYSERKELTGADGAALPTSQVIIATGVPSDDFSDLA